MTETMSREEANRRINIYAQITGKPLISGYGTYVCNVLTGKTRGLPIGHPGDYSLALQYIGGCTLGWVEPEPERLPGLIKLTDQQLLKEAFEAVEGIAKVDERSVEDVKDAAMAYMREIRFRMLNKNQES